MVPRTVHVYVCRYIMIHIYYIYTYEIMLANFGALTATACMGDLDSVMPGKQDHLCTKF